ncbi:indolepyruvate ferredoxin oxidoreductase subunit alpha [Thermincola ferriacetica]|uniref:Indolepyruvate oxidoreductase subunit IorA n=1 Tax=Thermincola ferriacetica TaxID=281456 RepID=A0A0L6W2S9_9FIRM|nr:indolepyruvate ferredoxin oxidoreductase subunit alpha [Thermincola ferriacetica]KNZ69776.1 indolepyruvate ferredoxin oxidoreductase subunit alpha [Thermincola ferriacetica]
MRALLTGNEAIARGAYEYGVKVAVGYPGTPSTEILENIAKYEGIKAQWSPNEKVAMEVGAGASIGGARVIVTMKHVGVNVAADPLFTFSYTGVNGGLVLISADDPGMHSSQNEQDNRNYARFAKIPMFEPSDSGECKEMMGEALKVSEVYDTPVMLRTTTRIAHSQSLVELKEPGEITVKEYVKDSGKFVMIPAHARQRRVIVEERLARLKEYAESCPFNEIQMRDARVGIIASGAAYQYVREVMPNVSVLKLGMTYPLPEKLIKDFAARVKHLFVVEELDPFLQDQVALMGLKVRGKDLFSNIGELSPKLIAEKFYSLEETRDFVEKAFLAQPQAWALQDNIPVRPPVMCPGCPHRGVFYVLNKMKLTVMGDIGCYTLGTLPPLEAMDACICMGASIGSALGMEKAHPEMRSKIVSVIGDSTFMHSGITGLLDIAYNKGTTATIILDNRTTAMTGHQEHPGTGKTLQQEETFAVDIPKLVQALGIRRIKVVDPFDLDNLQKILAEETEAAEPSVIIAQRPCALLDKSGGKPLTVDAGACIGCKRCMKLGCPALVAGPEKVSVNAALCTGCGLCAQTCNVGAIRKEGEGIA